MCTPTLGLVGPNSPARYAPVGPRAAALYLAKVPCSPCIQIHDGIVPECFHQEKGRCLLDIDVDSVFHAARRLLADGGLYQISASRSATEYQVAG
jgi:ADP-heptose:LPS heptosyltransferase